MVELPGQFDVPRLQMYLDIFRSVQLLWLSTFGAGSKVEVGAVTMARRFGVNLTQQRPTRCGVTRLFEHLALDGFQWVFRRIDRASGQLQGGAPHAVTILSYEYDLVVGCNANRTHPIDAIDQVVLIDVDSARRSNVLLTHRNPRPLDDGLGAKYTPRFHDFNESSFREPSLGVQ